MKLNKGLEGLFATVYFGNNTMRGKIDSDLEDRIIMTDPRFSNGDPTLIYKDAIAAITLHSEENFTKHEEPAVPSRETRPNPFVVIKNNKKQGSDEPVQDGSMDTTHMYSTGMYIPLTVINQDPESVNPLHSDDFSTSFGPAMKIDFSSDE